MTDREKWLIRALDRELDDAEREEKKCLLRRILQDGYCQEEMDSDSLANRWVNGHVAFHEGVAGVTSEEGFYPVAHDVTGSIIPNRHCLAELSYRGQWFVVNIKITPTHEEFLAKWGDKLPPGYA